MYSGWRRRGTRKGRGAALVVAAVLGCSGGAGGGAARDVSSITAEIGGGATLTWILAGGYTVGQYCTGDWWVVDAGAGVRVLGTSHTAPAGTTTAGEASEVNPRFGAQGYDSRRSPPIYDATLAASFPVDLHAGDTLVTVTRKPGDAAQLTSAAILTVVDQAQPADAFRPPYTRPARIAASAADPLRFRLSDIAEAKWALLPRKARVGLSQVPDLNATIGKVRGPWLDHLGGAEAGEIHPELQQPGYGYDLVQVVSEAAAQLTLDHPEDGLRALARNLVQIGIDNYGMVLAGGKWPPDGGHASGRKLPIVFAAVMLDDAAMKAFPREAPVGNAMEWSFGEDGQTYYFDDAGLPAYQGPPPESATYAEPGAGRVAVRGVRGWVGKLGGGSGDVALWRINADWNPGYSSTHEHVALPDWSPDYEYGQAKREAYRICCTSPGWIGQSLLVLLFGNDTGSARNELVSVWGHDAYFDYAYRWMSQDYAQAKVLYDARYFPLEIGGQQFTGAPFIDDLWARHRATFPVFRTSP